jgi:DNA-binding beta-propeller fold protein YncE
MSAAAETRAPVTGWSDLTERLPRTTGWMHSGVAVTPDGEILVAHPEGHALVRLAPTGKTTVVSVPLTELHSIAVTAMAGIVAVADPGHRFIRGNDGEAYGDEFEIGRAALVDLSRGSVLLELSAPDLPEYAEATWRPTSIAVDDGPGGTKDIWVADGYAKSLVHRFSGAGEYISTFDGAASGTAFDCPHGIMVRRTAEGFELFVADRTNCRIVVIDQHGTVKRTFGSEHLDSPSSLTTIGDELYVTELFGGVAHFAVDGTFIATLEPQRVRSHDDPGWPNAIAEDGSTQPPVLVDAQFNSPHGITSYAGDLYLTEWFIGGRLIRIDVGAADVAT